MSRPKANLPDPEASRPPAKPRPRAKNPTKTATIIMGGAGGSSVAYLSRFLKPPLDQILLYLSPFVATIIAEVWPQILDGAKAKTREALLKRNNRIAIRDVKAFVAHRKERLAGMAPDDPLRERVVEEIKKGEQAILDLELAAVADHFGAQPIPEGNSEGEKPNPPSLPA